MPNRPTRIENSDLARKAREDLYHRAYSRVNKAMARGFHIEAIAILESPMCDRLENLLQTIRPDSKVELSTLGKLFNSVDKEVEMGRAYPLKAPLDVNVGEGESWDEAAH